MILFDLKCGKGHVFEAWFRDGSAAETARPAARSPAPPAAAPKQRRRPWRPRRQRPARSPGTGASPVGAEPHEQGHVGQGAEIRRELGELRAKIEANCDYVGGRFAEEARQDPTTAKRSPRHLWRNLEGRGPCSEPRRASSSPSIPWLPRRQLEHDLSLDHVGTSFIQQSSHSRPSEELGMARRRSKPRSDHVIDVEIVAARRPFVGERTVGDTASTRAKPMRPHHCRQAPRAAQIDANHGFPAASRRRYSAPRWRKSEGFGRPIQGRGDEQPARPVKRARPP